MTFNSLDDIVAYIESIVATGMNEMGHEMEEIMKNEIMHQIYASYSPNQYKRTGQMENSPGIVEVDKDSVTVEFRDNGGWTDIKTGNHAFPMERFESGKVWSKGHTDENPSYLPATNIMEESVSKCESEIPRLLVNFLRSRGIPIE